MNTDTNLPLIKDFKNQIVVLTSDKIKDSIIEILEETKKLLIHEVEIEESCSATCCAIADVIIKKYLPQYVKTDLSTLYHNLQETFRLREAAKGIEGCNPYLLYWFEHYNEATLPKRLMLVDNAIKLFEEKE